jgi:mannose-1-phosphate guanylyltransferase
VADHLLKGLILAGGFATRLRPLSCSKPKLLFPLVGTPLIDRMLEWLTLGNVAEVILALNHFSDKMRVEVTARNLEDRVLLSIEDSPLGTGGPLRLAEPMLGDPDPVIVVNGDVACDIDLRSLAEAHGRSGAEATIALFSVRDTRPFGVVSIDSKNRIMRFEEKSLTNKGPGWINAGVYILNRTVIGMIPRGRAVSLEREVFPVLAEQMKLNGWKHSGFWYDIGKIQDYVKANMELLERPGYLVANPMSSAVGVELPSFLGDHCIVGDGARVGPRTILSRGVKVGRDAMIRDSIVFEEAVLGDNCRVDGAVIGEATSIGKGAIVGEGSVIAGEVFVPAGAVVSAGSMVLN